MHKFKIVVKPLLGEKYVEGKKKDIGAPRGGAHLFIAHALCVHRIAEKSKWKEEEKRKMPSLVANTSALARTT